MLAWAVFTREFRSATLLVICVNCKKNAIDILLAIRKTFKPFLTMWLTHVRYKWSMITTFSQFRAPTHIIHHHHFSREDNNRTWVQKIQMMTSSHCTTVSPSYVLKSAGQLLRIPTEPRLGKTQVGVQVANLWSWLRSEFGDRIELDDLIPPKKGTGGGLRAATTPLPRWADIHKALFAVSGNCRVQQSEKEA